MRARVKKRRAAKTGKRGEKRDWSGEREKRSVMNIEGEDKVGKHREGIATLMTGCC